MILTVTPNPCIHKIVTFRGRLDDRIVIRPVASYFLGGGKGVNAARAARALGAEVLALTTSGGHLGRLFADGLAAEGLPADIVLVRRPTRMSTLVQGADEGGLREYLEAGQPLDEDEIRALEERFDARLKDADLVTLNGSVPDAALDGFFARLVERALHAGRRVIVDTYGRSAVEASRARPHMLKGNLDELSQSFGVALDGPRSIRAFAEELRGGGIDQVLLTCGGEGAWLFTGEGSWRVLPPPVEERNPIGCGDAMLGGLAAALVRGDALLDAVRLGTAAGAANAARLGVCDFERAEVERLTEGVRLEES